MTHVPILLSRAAAAALATSAVLAVATPNAGAAPAGAAPAGAAPSIDGRLAADAPVQVGAALATGTRDASRGTSTAQRKRALARKRAAARRRAKSRAAKRGRRQSNLTVADALTNVPPYTGATGAVLHTRTVTVDVSTNPNPQRSKRFTSATEAWGEIGGGRRQHQVSQYTDPATGAHTDTFESWVAPQVFVRAGGGTALQFGAGAGWSVAIPCEPITIPDPPGFLRKEREALATLPAGPEINGVATRMAVNAFGPGGDHPSAVERVYLNASTGQPLRSTFQEHDSTSVDLVTDYLTWEVLPAGGPTLDLAPEIPADAQLSPGTDPVRGCIPRD